MKKENNFIQSAKNRYMFRDMAVPRECGGKYYLIDGRSKDVPIRAMNQMAYEMVKVMYSKELFTLEDIVEHICNILAELPEGGKDEIQMDVRKFLQYMMNSGFVKEDTLESVNMNGKEGDGVPDTSKTNLSEVSSEDIQLNSMIKDSIPYLVDTFYGPNRIMFQAGIELTTCCNLKCVHCYNQHEPRLKGLSTIEVKRMLDILYEHGIISLYFTGGEIFTRADFKEIYMYAKKKGFIMELLTNGTLITDDLIEMFKTYPPINISISVYGRNADNYGKVTGYGECFDLLMENLNKLKKADITFEIKYIGMKENEDDYDALEELANKLDVPFRYTYELFPPLHGENSVAPHQVSNEVIIRAETKNQEMCRILSNSVKNDKGVCYPEDRRLYLCSIARYLIVIDHEGYFQPCTEMRLKKYHILKDDLDEAWKEFGKYIDVRVSPDYKCLSCEDFYFCGQCVQKNYLFTGELETPYENRCQLIHQRIQEFSKPKYDIYRKKS